MEPQNALARGMQEIGFACSIEASVFRGMMQQVGAEGRMDDRAVAEVLAVMARTTPANLPQESQAAIANGGISMPGTPILGDGSNSGIVGWAWRIVLDAIKSCHPNLNWHNVAEALDSPVFMIHSVEGFYLLVHAYRYGSGGEQLPVKAMVGRKWTYEMGQLSFLQYAVSAPAELFSFASSERKLASVEGLQGGKSATGTPNQAWLSIDLLQIMCHFTVDAAKRPAVLAMLEYPIKHCPEVLLLAMASVPEDTQLLQREVYSVLLPPYLANRQGTNTQLVLRRLWAANPRLVKEMLVEYFVQDHHNLARIYEICTDLQVLSEVLNDTPSVRFALHLAVHASSQAKATTSGLEVWANSRFNREPVMMIHEAILFLYTRLADMQAAGPRGPVPRLPEEVVSSLIRLLLPLRRQLAWDFWEAYNYTADLVAKLYPSQKQLLQAPLFSSHETENDAKQLLQRMHSRQMSPEDVLAQIQKLKSGPPRDQELLSAFIFQLLNEFPVYIYDQFQDKDLVAAGRLYGALTAEGVFPRLAQGMALRFILFALRSQPGARVIAFGMSALRSMLRAIRPFSAFCEQVLLSQSVREGDPQLFAQIDAAYRDFQAAVNHGTMRDSVVYAMLPPLSLPGLPPPGAPKAPPPIAPAPPSAAPPGMGKGPMPPQPPPGQRWPDPHTGAAAQSPALPWGRREDDKQIDKNKSLEGNDIEGELESQLLSAPAQPVQPAKPTLGVNSVSLENASEKHPAPPEGAVDRIFFLINNLSEDNVEQRASDIKSKVLPTYLGWFSEYMAKRAAQEVNYQPLYLRMLDKMNDKMLIKQLVKSTYFYCQLLLTGDRSVANSNDRALLKNLGHWLGALTFKREKPVLSKELDLKQMVIEAYQRGRLVAVLPFLANLLSCCDKSKVFVPSNPMISGLLSLLAELHKLPHLKFNAQYCIEMIFKTFSNPQVEPTNILATLTRDHVNNQDFANIIDDSMDKGLMSPEITSNMQAMMSAAAVKAFNQHVGVARTPAKGAPGGPPGAPGTPSGMQQAALSPQPGMGPMGGQVQQAMLSNAAAMGQHQSMGADANKQDSLQMPRPSPPGGAPPPSGPPGQGGAPGMGPPTPPVPVPTGLCMEHNAMIQYLSTNAAINPSLGAIAERLMLKRWVPLAIERAIVEILNPVVERSVTIACYTTSELLSKDFAMDPDETRMRKAAHLMVSSLAGSLSLVTCKDPLRIALSNHLTQLLSAHLNATTAPQGGMATAVVDKATLDQVVTVVVQDNLESCCSVFERAATDKAVRDVDKQLADKYEERVQAKKTGRQFVDQHVYHGRFPAQLPDSLRPKHGMITPMQLRVYEDFARIPRSPPPPQPAAPLQNMLGVGGRAMYGEEGVAGQGKDGVAGAVAPPVPPVGAANMATVETQYSHWQQLVDSAAAKADSAGETSSAELSALMDELTAFVTNAAGEEALRFFVQRIFQHVFEVAGTPIKIAVPFYVSALRTVMTQLASKGAGTPNLGAAWGMMVDDERRYNPLACEALLRAGLFSNLQEYDTHLARGILATRSAAAQELAAHLTKTLLLRDHVLAFTDLSLSTDALGKVAMGIRASNAHNPAAVQQAEAALAVVEQVRRAAAGLLVANRPAAELLVTVRDKAADPPNFKEQVQAQLEDWLRLITSSPGVSLLATNPVVPNVTEADRAALAGYLNNVKASGMLKDEATTERWIRMSMDIAINHSLGMGEQAALQGRVFEAHQLYVGVDAMWRLLAAMVLHGGGLAFARSSLNVLVGVVKRDADERSIGFNGRPHLRLLVGLMTELLNGSSAVAQANGSITSADMLDPFTMRYVRLFAEALHSLQPLSVPGWAFCWLTAIAHRSFMPRLLLNPGTPLMGWQMYESLLVGLLRFLEPHLKSSDQLTDCIRALYKGTLRLLLVLLHDFPEFLCEHHFPLCDAMPVSCVQLRNLVLSAFPRNMRLPDPFTHGLKVDLLPEILQLPRVLPEPDHLLDRHADLKSALDSYLRNRTPATLPADLAKAFKATPSSQADGNAKAVANPGYNVSLINSVVMYVGAASAARAHAAGGGSATLDGPSLDIFLRLMSELDSEGRYLVLNAAANQLRYPNAHTYTFSCLLLSLFLEVQQEAVQEQITRVLLERLVVNRPHPWGLLITFIELIKNPRYMFWTHEFTRNGPDVERLFKNVAASCMAHPAANAAPGAQPGAGVVAGQAAASGMLGPTAADKKEDVAASRG